MTAPRSVVGRLRPEDLAPVAPRRPAGSVVFEMHAHSSERSLDSGVRAEVLAKQARERGFDGICLTDHNALWSPHEVLELSERCELTVLAGMELGTDSGHVLVYGLDRYHPELLMLERLRHIVEEEGAAMVIAHPMRTFHGTRPGWSEFPRWFHGAEVINADHPDTEHSYIARHAGELGLALIAGSDAHTRDAVGRVGTVFPHAVRDTGDIVDAIVHRRTAILDFRGGPAEPGDRALITR